MSQPDQPPLKWLILAARYVMRRVQVKPRHLERDLNTTYAQAAALLRQLEAWRIVTDDRGPGGRIVLVALKHEDLVKRVLEQNNGLVPDPNPLDAVLLPVLTGRQRHVLQLVAEGKTVAEIAKELVVTVNTVKTHIHHLYGLLGARRSAANLVHQAHLKGLLPQPHLLPTSGKDSQ